jgi:hypothetical protein
MRITCSYVLGFALLAGAAPAAANAQVSAAAASGSSGVAIDIACRAQNDFGYVATATGTLQVTSRPQPNLLFASGILHINAKYFDQADRDQAVRVEGTLDVFGQYFSGAVLSGADDLQSLFLAFVPNGMSDVQAKDSTQYQTECTQSSVHLPAIADLVATHGLRFTTLPDGQLRASVDVSNVGNATVSGPAARLRIADVDVTGTLYNAAASANALQAGEQGYIQVDLPANTLTRCGEYSLILDLDHSLQSGAFDPFANDLGQASTPCLRWNTPISDDALGVSADPLIRFKTLESIVSSEVIVRSDGMVCSGCHFAGSGKPYSPSDGTITPTQNIGGRSWSAAGGWLDEFEAQSIKPEYLKQAFRRWREDGAL